MPKTPLDNTYYTTFIVNNLSPPHLAPVAKAVYTYPQPMMKLSLNN